MIRNTWPDVKLGFRWYSWNIQPFDNSYPEFFPQPGVKEFCEEARKEGYLVMPYVNGRLWDQGLRSFRYAKRTAVRMRPETRLSKNTGVLSA